MNYGNLLGYVAAHGRQVIVFGTLAGIVGTATHEAIPETSLKHNPAIAWTIHCDDHAADPVPDRGSEFREPYRTTAATTPFVPA